LPSDPVSAFLGRDVIRFSLRPTGGERARRLRQGGGVVLHRLRELERENARLKKIVADLTLDREMLQEVIKRKL
jgi:hypothetical protein